MPCRRLVDQNDAGGIDAAVETEIATFGDLHPEGWQGL